MSSKFVEFKNDDKGYFAWLMAHPAGYVLNVRREPDLDYVVLHRATCGTISSRKRSDGAYTCKGFRKWCSDQLAGLAGAAKLEGRKDGTFSKECGLCLG